MKYQIVRFLEWLCSEVDNAPMWTYYILCRWIGCVGYRGGLVSWAIALDRRWRTGYFSDEVLAE